MTYSQASSSSAKRNFISAMSRSSRNAHLSEKIEEAIMNMDVNVAIRYWRSERREDAHKVELHSRDVPQFPERLPVRQWLILLGHRT